MSAFRAHKLVAALPDPLEPNALYLLRAGAGFDLYASDQTGSVAHKLNADEGTGGTGGFTPASQSAANAAYIYFDLGNRINLGIGMQKPCKARRGFGRIGKA